MVILLPHAYQPGLFEPNICVTKVLAVRLQLISTAVAGPGIALPRWGSTGRSPDSKKEGCTDSIRVGQGLDSIVDPHRAGLKGL